MKRSITAVLTLLAISMLSTGCVKFPKTADEVRKNAVAGNLGTDMESVDVQVPLRLVVKRVGMKAAQCMHYEATIIGGGTQIFTHEPELVKVSSSKVSLVMHTRYRFDGALQNTDEKGITFVADMKALSQNDTKVTTYSNTFGDHFHKAVISAAQGEQDGPCPAED